MQGISPMHRLWANGAAWCGPGPASCWRLSHPITLVAPVQLCVFFWTGQSSWTWHAYGTCRLCQLCYRQRRGCE